MDAPVLPVHATPGFSSTCRTQSCPGRFCARASRNSYTARTHVQSQTFHTHLAPTTTTTMVLFLNAFKS